MKNATGTGERHLHQHRQGELPDANNRFSEGEYDNRNNLKDEQRNTVHIFLVNSTILTIFAEKCGSNERL